MSVPSVASFDPAQFFRPPAAGAQRLDTQVGAIAVSNDVTGSLTVSTAEGDTVTLSAHLREQFSAATYQGHAQQDGTAVEVNGRQAEYDVSQELGVTVQGDLSEQEVKDLSKLFRKVLNIFRKFFNGQDEAALAKTAALADRFGNLPSLSDLDLSVTVERSVSAVAAQVAAETSGQPGGSGVDPTQTGTAGVASSTAAAIPSPSSGATAPTQPAPPSSNDTGARTATHVTTAATDGERPQSLVEQVLNAVQESKVEGDKLKRHLPRLLDKIREELQQELRDRQQAEPKADASPAQSGGTVAVAYQSFTQTALTLSLHL